MGCAHSAAADNTTNANTPAQRAGPDLTPRPHPEDAPARAAPVTQPVAFHPDAALERPYDPQSTPAAALGAASGIRSRSLDFDAAVTPMWRSAGTQSSDMQQLVPPRSSPPVVISAVEDSSEWPPDHNNGSAAANPLAPPVAFTPDAHPQLRAPEGASAALHAPASFPALDPAHDEESALDAARGPQDTSHAITMDELPGDMHLQRIEGRGNMARMHGYTADIHQFPAPPPLTARERRAVERKCRRWLRRVKTLQSAETVA